MSTHQITFAINGMFCAKCAVTIEQTLTRIDGIIAVHVNYATERAMVMFNPARASLSTMASAVQGVGFHIPQERIILNVDDLVYASSPQTVERVLSRVDGVVNSHVEIQNQQIILDVLAGQVQPDDYERALAKLGLHVAKPSSSNKTQGFTLRTLLISGLAVLSLFSAGAHVGLYQAPLFHTPLVVITIAVLVAHLIGWRFFQLAYDACIQGEFDVGVLLALTVSFSLLGGLVLALVSPSKWLTDLGFLLAILLTVSWFATRSTMLLRRSLDPKISKALLAGVLASVVMLGIYLITLTVLMGFTFAFQQVGRDSIWIMLVALGFGIQIGLYTYLRTIIHSINLTSATAVTSVGAGTSTLGMIACCVHHLSDIAPLVALAGVSSLSSVISFFNDWKYAVIALGLATNALGIVVIVHIIQKSKIHLETMPVSTAAIGSTGP